MSFLNPTGGGPLLPDAGGADDAFDPGCCCCWGGGGSFKINIF